MRQEVVDFNRHVTKMWSDGGGGHYTKREPMYMGFLRDMVPGFDGGSVLEVGPGTGLFAKMMFEGFDLSSYTVLDLEENIRDSQKLLSEAGYDCECVCSQDFESLFGRRFDLFVSNVCLPETPDYYREALCEGVLAGCRFAFVIGGDDKKTPGSPYGDWIRKVFAERFDVVVERETGYCGTFAIGGFDES